MIIFKNKGEIDPRSIKTFGVSSKEKEGAIGFFGTGLKYAIAILLRTGHRVTVYSGETKLEFGLEAQTIRVDEFDVVTMNGEALAFTTELGKTWELWQAYREIHCNTLDENGEMKEVRREPKPKAGTTLVVVEGEAFSTLFHDNDVTLATAPLARGHFIEVHPGPAKHIYYQGIRAGEIQGGAHFTYNIIGHAELTEDRTLKSLGTVLYGIARDLLTQVRDVPVLEKILQAKEGAEAKFDFDGWTHYLPSEVFHRTVVDLHREFKHVNASALNACHDQILSNVARHKPKTLDEVDRVRLERAVDFCKRLGYPVDDYPIVVSDYMGEDILGRAAEGTIFLSHRVFLQGSKQVVATLIEEFVHLRYGFQDETYRMQTFLFDAVVTMGERLLGEPL